MNLNKYSGELGQSDPQKAQIYVAITSQDIYMIFSVKVAYIMEIVKITKVMAEKLGQTTPKFSPEIGLKLPYIYST